MSLVLSGCALTAEDWEAIGNAATQQIQIQQKIDNLKRQRQEQHRNTNPNDANILEGRYCIDVRYPEGHIFHQLPRGSKY